MTIMIKYLLKDRIGKKLRGKRRKRNRINFIIQKFRK